MRQRKLYYPLKKNSLQNTKALHYPWLGRNTFLYELTSPLEIHSQPQILLLPLDFQIEWKKWIAPSQRVLEQSTLQRTNFS